MNGRCCSAGGIAWAGSIMNGRRCSAAAMVIFCAPGHGGQCRRHRGSRTHAPPWPGINTGKKDAVYPKRHAGLLLLSPRVEPAGWRFQPGVMSVKTHSGRAACQHALDAQESAGGAFCWGQLFAVPSAPHAWCTS